MIHIEEPQQAINENEGQQTPATEAPTVEPKTTEGEVVETTETTPDPSTPEVQAAEPEVKKPTRAEKRLHQLLEDRREERQVVQPQQTGFNPQSFINPPPWEGPQVQPGQEITPDQYKADVTRTADEVTQLRLRQFQNQLATERAFEKTTDQLERQFPALNPDAPEYNERLSSKIVDLYEKSAGKRQDPTLLKAIVESMMDLSSLARTEGQKAVTNQLVKQQAEAAITPTGSRTAETDFDTALKIKDPKARQKALERILPVAQ